MASMYIELRTATLYLVLTAAVNLIARCLYGSGNELSFATTVLRIRVKDWQWMSSEIILPGVKLIILNV